MTKYLEVNHSLIVRTIIYQVNNTIDQIGLLDYSIK